MATLVPTTNAIMTGQPAYPTAGSLTSTKVPTTPTPTSTSPLPVSTSQQAIQNNNSAQGALNTALVGAQSQAAKKTTSAQQDAAAKSPQLASQLAVQAGLNPADVAAYMKANPSVNADAVVGNLLSMPQKQAQPQGGAVVGASGASSGTVNSGTTATGGTMGDASGQQNAPNPVGTNSLLDNEAQRKADLDVLNAKTAKDNQDYLDKIAQVQNGTFPLTPGQQAQIDALKAQFDNLKSAQDLANQNYTQGITRLGIASGRSQYAPELEMGNIKATIDQGIQKLQQLDIQKASAVAQLQGAFETQDFDMVKSAYDVLQRTDAAQTAAINKLHDDTAAALKDTRDFADKLKQENQDQENADRTFEQTKLQNKLSNDIATNRLSFEEADATIKNAQADQRLTEQQAQDLRSYSIQLKQLDQGKYLMTQDAMGNPVPFNKSTGKFEPSALPNIAGSSGSGSKSGIDSSNNSAFKSALVNATIGYTDKEQKVLQSQVSEQLASGDMQGAKETIMNAALRNEPSTVRQSAEARLQSIAALNNIGGLLNAYVKQSGDTDILKGTIENAAQKIGKTTDPALAKIKEQIDFNLQQYRHAMTGAAFSQQESQAYASVLPQVSNANDLNSAKIGSMIDIMNLQQKVSLQNAIGSQNYDKIFGGKAQVTDVGTWKSENPKEYENVKQMGIANNWSEQDTLQYINHLNEQSSQ